MEGTLTIKAALEKILSENKNILNNAKDTVTALTKYVSPEYTFELDDFIMALLKGNIGEFLMTADKAAQETREKKKTDAVLRLTTTPVHMQPELAESVVQTLTDAMGWNNKTESSPAQIFNLEDALRFIPVIDTEVKSTQSDINEGTSNLTDSTVKKVDNNAATKINPHPHQSTDSNKKINHLNLSESTLTIKAALEKILSENKNILNNAKDTVTALTNYVSPKYKLELYPIIMALLKGNIGEFLMTADKAAQETREKKKTDAVLRLTTTPVHMQPKLAESVVQTLTDAMGWNSNFESPPPPPINIKQNKLAWRIALVACVIAGFLYSYLNSLTHQMEEAQNELYNNESLLSGHEEIEKNLGFGSKDYYSKKPFAILRTSNSSENSFPTSVILPIYFTVPQSASASYSSSSDAITLKWMQDQFDDNHKADLKISSTEKKGYYNVHLTNSANNDSFDVLVIVR